MKKRLLSLAMVLTMMFSMMPSAAFADEEEEFIDPVCSCEEHCEESSPNADCDLCVSEPAQCAVTAVTSQEGNEEQPEDTKPIGSNEESDDVDAVAAFKKQVEALPDVETLQNASNDELIEYYSALSETNDAYDSLTPEQQQELTVEAAKLDALNKFFNSMTATVLSEETHSHVICGKSDCTDAGHEDVTWTGVSTLTNNMAEGCYYLTDDVTLHSAWEIENKNIKLCLNGHSITTDGDYTIYAKSNAVLTLTDCNESGSVYEGSCTGIKVEQSTLNMYHVTVTGSDSTKSTGVELWSATFNMYSGTITNGQQGVYICNSSSFNMYGGTITGNSAYSHGGGVDVTGNSCFNMYGGTITGNYATAYGGGVSVTYSSSFNMSGGSITANRARYSGGGVYVSGCSFKISGGSITGNTNDGYGGGGVALDGGTMTISGNINISGNKYNDSDSNVLMYNNSGGQNPKYIIIDGKLENTEKIGVSFYWTNSACYQGIFTSGWSDYMNGEDFGKYFTNENEYYYNDENKAFTMYKSGGELAMYTAHTHDDETWKFINSLSEITGAGHYVLLEDIELSDASWKPVDGVYLCLNGHSITQTKNWASTIDVNSGVSFTLTDCKNSGKITHKDSSGSGVSVNDGGTFNMRGGIITGNNCSGVAVNSGSTFNMHGGEISGNTNNQGGGVKMANATFNMYDGSISRNTATGTYSGGGVYVYGTFNMYGGSISNNIVSDDSADAQGGGVYVGYGNANIKGGTISGNSAVNGGGVAVRRGNVTISDGAKITGNAATSGSGGGVYVSNGGWDVSFTMSGGEISCNTAAQKGGGVYVESGSDNLGSNNATLTGGRISGNTASSSGGGVYVGNKELNSLTIGGSLVIIGNKVNDSDSNLDVSSTNKVVTVQEDLNSSFSVGVTAKYKTDFTSGWNSRGLPGSYFTSDNSEYTVAVNDSGELYIIDRHTHAVTDGGESKDWIQVSSLDKITDAGYYYLKNNVTVSSTWTVPSGEVYLCLNGKTITSNGSAISVPTGATLTICSCEDKGAISSANGSAINVSGGTLYVYGGSISGTATSGGALCLISGKVYIEGGSISGTATSGGAVYMTGGEFNFYSGSISGTASTNGGAVYVAGGTFDMDGWDKVKSISNSSAMNGGGVYVAGGTLKMVYGGSITGNNASGNGGGIYVSAQGSLDISYTTTISGNTATQKGGGIYVCCGASVKLTGEPVITGNRVGGYANNLYLSAGAAIWGNSLYGNAKVGITTETVPDENSYVDVSIVKAEDERWSYSFSQNAINYIVADDGSYHTAWIASESGDNESSYMYSDYGTIVLAQGASHSHIIDGTSHSFQSESVGGTTSGYYYLTEDADEITLKYSDYLDLNGKSFKSISGDNYTLYNCQGQNGELSGSLKRGENCNCSDDSEWSTTYGYTVSGDFVLTGNITIKEGETLTINEDAILTVAKGATLTIEDGAKISNNGKILVYGEVSAADYAGIYAYLDLPENVTASAANPLEVDGEIFVRPGDTVTLNLPVLEEGGVRTLTINGDGLDAASFNMPNCGSTLSLSDHYHNWVYTKEDKTITATCDGCDTSGGYVSLVTPCDTKYNGNFIEAVADDGNITNGTGRVVEYQVYENGDFVAMDGKPIYVGNYKAIMSWGNQTVYVTYEITPATLSPSISGTTVKTYDGTTSAAGMSISLSGIVNNDEVSATANFAYDSADVSASKITASNIRLTGTMSGNYVLFDDTASTNGAITAKDISGAQITLGDSLTYNGETQTQTIKSVTVDGLTVSIYTVSNNTGKDAGDSYKLTVTGKGNFTGEANAEFKISQAANTWTVKPNIDNWIYGNAASTPSYEASFGTDTVIVEYKAEDGADSSYSTAVPTDSGNYTMRVSIAETTNYTDLQETVSFTIEQKTAVLSWIVPESWTYGDKDKYVTASVINAESGDTVTVYITGGDETTSGKYIATAESLSDKNYKLPTDGTATMNYTIAPKSLTVTADAQTKKYSQSDPELTFTYDCLLDGDSFTGALTRESGEKVGEYAITQGTLSAGTNYAIDFTGAKLTITANPGATITTTTSGEGDSTITVVEDDGGNKVTTVEKSDGTKLVTTTDSKDNVTEKLTYAANGSYVKDGYKPTLIEGNGSTYNRFSSMTFRSDDELINFLNVYVDGNMLSEGNYTVESGSIKVILKTSYLNTLAAGTHTIAVESTNGQATGTFIIESRRGVATGDSSNITMWCITMAFSGLASGSGLILLRRKKEEK